MQTRCPARFLSGDKTQNFGDDCWCEHDERYDVDMDDFVDDPGYAEGMICECCERSLDSEGCKVRQHEPRW